MRIWCLCIATAILCCGCGKQVGSTSTATTAVSTTPSSSISAHPTSEPNSTTSSEAVYTTLSGDAAQPTQNVIDTTISPTTQVTATDGKTSATATSTAVTTPSSTSSTSSATTTCPGTTFTTTVRNDQRQLVSGVTVSVWSDDVLLGQGITDNKGVARISLYAYDAVSVYRVKLSNLPTGYEADAEYRFSSTTVNVTIRKSAVQNEQDHSQAQYEKGQKMTDFALTDIDGNTYRLSTLLEQKQLIILDFWYTTCEPCKMEFPYFEAALQKYGDAISLLAINPINDNQAMAALRQQLGTTFPMLKDTCNLYLGFEVTAYPTTVFIDSNGTILDIHYGAYSSEQAFLAAVERYLH